MRRKVHPEEETGELNIVPYLDIVVNLVMFLLLSIAGVLSLGILDVGTPKLGQPDSASLASPSPDKQPFNLTVGITDQGFYVAGTGGVLEGDSSAGVDTKRPPTVPLKSGKHDYAGLGEVLGKV